MICLWASLCLLLTSNVFAADAKRGEKLVASCAACHGKTGNSTAPTFPNLAGNGQKYLAKQLRDIKAKRREITEMTGLLDNNSDQDLQDMAAYYASQDAALTGAKDSEVRLNSGEITSALKLGKKIYRGGNIKTNVPACTGCHSPTGSGNNPAVYPRLSGQHADYIAKQLYDFRAGKRVNDGDSQVMREVAANMSDAEIEAVANFIAGLN